MEPSSFRETSFRTEGMCSGEEPEEPERNIPHRERRTETRTRTRFDSRRLHMDFSQASSELKQLLSKVDPPELQKVLTWIRDSDELDQLLVDNRKVMLRSIADDLRTSLPPDAMLPSEVAAHHKMQQRARPTVHVDAFLYEDEQVDALCEEGTMSRTFCLACGSQRTAPLDFISHSFSVSELQFLFQNVLPDLSGRTLVDVGSRLGAVLYGGHVYSSASRLIGLELSEDFVRLQNDMLQKYKLNDRVQLVFVKQQQVVGSDSFKQEHSGEGRSL
ncbi:unnamed protein product [Pleuronectes platessa]|uniref:Uncharacterized protein n=1 Tax=Pleuronectes platessa TaxID=8262 RepID=A0A9N7TPW5_PLEPL|nr:unnamed protein product [Pleuronectes platessa]